MRKLRHVPEPARQAFARADEHWSRGESGDPAGLLDPTRRLDLKASFAMTDGRFEEALSLLRETLTGARSDRYREAESLLPRIEAMTGDLGNELDGWRVLWLKGRTWSGLGQKEEGLRALSQVREYFLSKKIAYDFALVSLEVATLYLEEGRTREVRELAEEMLWIFKSQGVHKEALAALRLFCQAAREEKARVEWTRGLVKYLYRAQHNPKLRFEG